VGDGIYHDLQRCVVGIATRHLLCCLSDGDSTQQVEFGRTDVVVSNVSTRGVARLQFPSPIDMAGFTAAGARARIAWQGPDSLWDLGTALIALERELAVSTI
jgi:hypothetical protein